MRKDADIAVLLTSHNRAEKTLAALQHVFEQHWLHSAALTVYLVDDGCTDGTPARVSARFPAVRIIAGSGELFWAGGMALAFATALRQGHEFYLWLNDDTMIFSDALARLLRTYTLLRQQRGASDHIVVGATRDPETGQLTSSGLRSTPFRPLHFSRIAPSDTPQPCTTFQGNCVLIPAAVAEDVGSIDESFRHYLGDIDYGLRAAQKRHEIWLAPHFAGSCASDLRAPFTAEGRNALGTAISRLRHPKGLNLANGTLYSFSEWAHFAARHGGPLWVIHFLSPYRRLVRLLLPSQLSAYKKTTEMKGDPPHAPFFRKADRDKGPWGVA
jgi:GT2 family glycosyltransferase